MAGKRVGYKRSDKRWKDESGQVWASKFEWEVYDTLLRSGVSVRKCDSSDTFSYTEPRPNVKCMACGSCECMQERTYTPDLYIVPKGGKANSGGYYLEIKGYFRDEKRRLFRCLRNSRPDIDLRVVFATNAWVTRGKTRMSDYFDKYVKGTPYHFWNENNMLPEEWL
jgi:hypothetical protein